MSKDKQPRPRGTVAIEEVPEEAYSDLLPYEMERTEFIMGTFFKDHEQKLVKSIERNAQSETPSPVGKKDWDRVREEGAKVTEIHDSIAAAREVKVNNWGHRWRPSPTVEADHFSKSDAKIDGPTPTMARPPFPPDPILDAAVTEFKASDDYKKSPRREFDKDPNEVAEALDDLRDEG